MAKKFIRLSILWILVALLATPTKAQSSTLSTEETNPSGTEDHTASANPSAATEDQATSGPTAATDDQATSGPTAATEDQATSLPTATTEDQATSGPTATTEDQATSGPTATTEDQATSGPTAATDDQATSGPTAATVDQATSGPTAATDNQATSGPTAATDNQATSGPTAATEGPATSDNPSSSTTGDSAAPTTSKTVPSTTAPPGPCDSNPCGFGSTCEPRANHEFVCMCLPGDFYNNITLRCENAKVFPGKLQLNKTFNDKMTDRTSKEFKETADAIVAALDEVYKGKDGYSGAVVLKLLPSTTRVLTASREVIAVVQIIFKASSEITEDDVIQELKDNPCNNCVLSGAVFERTDLCAENPCDVKTSNCTSLDGSYSCTCLEKYVQTNFSDRMCTACPSGFKFEDNTCVKCSFGYSGSECSENWQLILVIVGSVLGGLLLIVLILLPIMSTTFSNKISKNSEDGDMENPYMSQISFKFKGFSNLPILSNGVPKLPRATNSTTTNSITNLEMTSNSRQSPFFVDNSSVLYSDQNNTNPYTQARPQNNPYAVNRPQIKPHAQSQGYDNPYYQYDSESNFS